jgi:hypothetical protein
VNRWNCSASYFRLVGLANLSGVDTCDRTEALLDVNRGIDDPSKSGMKTTSLYLESVRDGSKYEVTETKTESANLVAPVAGTPGQSRKAGRITVGYYY